MLHTHTHIRTHTGVLQPVTGGNTAFCIYQSAIECSIGGSHCGGQTILQRG